MVNLLERILSQYGFGVVISIVICIFFYIVLKWLLKHVDKLVGLLEGYKTALDDLVLNIKTYTNNAVDAHKFQKDEHKKMVDALDGIQEAIGRINGYKKTGG